LNNRNFRTALFIALRHLFSKKKHNIVNIISIISAVGVMSGTAALIIVLSVFNGMEALVTDSFNSFNPDIKITLQEGKSFSVDSFPIGKIEKIEGVRAVEKVISDLVLIEYGEKQHLLLLKGVDPDYGGQSGFDSLLIDGSFVLQDEGVDYGVMGAIAAGTLQLNLNSNEFVKVYYPKRTRKNLGNPTDAFQTRYLTPIGVFCSYTEYDNEYLICSIEFAANLMSYENQVTSVEIFVNNENETDNIQQQITQILGDKYVVKNRFQQEELLFKTMKSEKMIIFSILAFILIIAGFNIIGSLGMIVIEKKEDMAVLHHLGANKSMIRRIFMLEGMIISFVGGVIGMLIGLGVCILQQIFHIISFGGDSGSYIIDYYPVKIEALDFLIVFGTIFIISFIASLIPIKNLQFKNEIKK